MMTQARDLGRFLYRAADRGWSDCQTPQPIDVGARAKVDVDGRLMVLPDRSLDRAGIFGCRLFCLLLPRERIACRYSTSRTR